MTSKFLLITGCLFALVGLGLVVNGFILPSAAIEQAMAPNSVSRTIISFAIFSGALHLLFVGLRHGGDTIFWCAPVAFCEAVIGMLLTGNAVPFAEHSPAGNASIGITVLGLILLVSGLTMAIYDGRLARGPKLAAA